MDHRELSLIGKLDNGLVKGLYIMLTWFKNIGIWLLGLFLLFGSFVMIFEYDEGLADVSWHEWGFLLLMPLLLWRHVYYCQHFATGFWRGLSRLLTAQGILCVLFFLGLFLLYLLSAIEHQESFHLYLTQEDPVDKLVNLGLVLLVVYLAAPVSKGLLIVKQTVSDPSISTVPDEVVQ